MRGQGSSGSPLHQCTGLAQATRAHPSPSCQSEQDSFRDSVSLPRLAQVPHLPRTPKFSPSDASERLNCANPAFWTRIWGFPRALRAGSTGQGLAPSFGPEQTAHDPGRPGSPSHSPPPRTSPGAGACLPRRRPPRPARSRGGGGWGGLVRAPPRFAGRRIRRRDAGSRGTASRGPLLIHPAVSMAPPPSSAPSSSRARRRARARPGGSRGGGGCGAEPRGPGAGAARRSQAPGARRGAPQSYPPGSCATSAGPARHPRARPHSRSVPHRARRRGPRAQRSPRPGRLARGRGAAQAKLLSCLARSEVAAETAASRPLPGLGGSEHTPTRHHPLPALAPAAPARTRQHPLPAPARSPGFQRSRAGGGRTPPPRSSGGWGGREEGG